MTHVVSMVELATLTMLYTLDRAVTLDIMGKAVSAAGPGRLYSVISTGVDSIY